MNVTCSPSPSNSPATPCSSADQRVPETAGEGPTPLVSKSCGHMCVATGQLEACCECVLSLDTISDHFQSCEICKSRQALTRRGCNCSCPPNTLNKFCPLHGSRGQSSSLQTPIDAPHPRHRNRKQHKNCIVM